MNPWEIIGWIVLIWLLLIISLKLFIALLDVSEYTKKYVKSYYQWFKTRNRAVEVNQVWQGEKWDSRVRIRYVGDGHYSLGSSTYSFPVKKEDWATYIRRNKLHLEESGKK